MEEFDTVENILYWMLENTGPNLKTFGKSRQILYVVFYVETEGIKLDQFSNMHLLSS